MEWRTVAESGLPTAVEDFIKRHIDSVEQLEVLLLLHHDPTRAWTAEAVSRELYSNPMSVGRRLAGLQSDGLLLQREGAGGAEYRYDPRSPVLDDTVREVAATYRERRVAVTNYIFAHPTDYIRVFSDAFRFR